MFNLLRKRNIFHTTQNVKKLELPLFISSTFQDMQEERNILSRLVLPKLRDEFSKNNTSIKEIDLRWGITIAMNENEGAVQICLDEIERCSPSVFCIIGHRTGWKPKLSWLDSEKREVLSDIGAGQGLTEIEITYASYLSSINKTVKPVIFFRDERLSKNLGFYDESFETSSFRKRISLLRESNVISYSSLEEFEERAEKEIKKLIEKNETYLQKYTPTAKSKIITSISKAKLTNPALIYYEENIGLSWALRELSNRKIHLIDGRRSDIDSIIDEISEPSFLENTKKGCFQNSIFNNEINEVLIIDHFEDSFNQANRSNISTLPAKNTNSRKIVISSKQLHLKHQAEFLGWEIIEIESPTKEENIDLANNYLYTFRKSLTQEQVLTLRSAKWIRNIGTLIITLDELRRFGNIEKLSYRLKELVKHEHYIDLFKDIFHSLRSTLPMKFSNSFDSIFIALSITSKGITEEELLVSLQTESAHNLELLSLWSTFQISFSSIISYKQGYIYISKPEVIENLHTFIDCYEEKTKTVIDKLKNHFHETSIDRWFEEATTIIYLENGLTGIERFIFDPKNTLAAAKKNSADIKKWFSKLSLETRDRIVSNWITKSHLSNDEFWRLTNIVLNSLPPEKVLMLMDKDSSKKRKSLRLMMASELLGDLESTNQIQTILLRKVSLSSNEALFLINSFLNGFIELTKKQMNDIHHNLLSNLHKTPNLTFNSQAYISLGNLDLSQAKWKHAAKKFEQSVSLSRQSGNADLLCKGLERCATSYLELNKFSRAIALLIESRSVAEITRNENMELVCIELLIDTNIRLGEWSKAYILVAEYHSKCKLFLNDSSKAKLVLSRIESKINQRV